MRRPVAGEELILLGLLLSLLSSMSLSLFSLFPAYIARCREVCREPLLVSYIAAATTAAECSFAQHFLFCIHGSRHRFGAKMREKMSYIAAIIIQKVSRRRLIDAHALKEEEDFLSRRRFHLLFTSFLM